MLALIFRRVHLPISLDFMKIANKMISIKNLLLLILFIKAVMSQEHTNLTCFSSSLPAAHEMMRIYDDDKPNGDFWSKHSQISCNFSKSPECLVCPEKSVKPETVFVICSNLPVDVDLKFEGPNGDIKFNKTNCPEPPSDEHLPQMKVQCFNNSSSCSTSSPPVTTHTEIQSNKCESLCISVIVVVFVVVVFVVGVLVYKCQQKKKGNVI